MPAYEVQHSYSSYPGNGLMYGPWHPGQVIELSVEDAEHVNRDSAGTLVATARPAERQGVRPDPDGVVIAKAHERPGQRGQMRYDDRT